MEKLLVFAAVLGVAYGGGRRLSESESRPILDGFETLCRSGQIGASGGLVDLDGEKTWVYCKRAGGKIVHENTQEKTFDVREPPPQAVFVNPPDISLRQRVLVSGKVKSPRTKVFVVPNKVDTSVDIDVQSQTERPNKPTVYFLNNGQDGSSSSGSSSGQSRLSDSSLEDGRDTDSDTVDALSKLSTSDLRRLAARNQERARSTLPQSEDDGIDAASSGHAPVSLGLQEQSDSDDDSSSLSKREATYPTFTHAIKIGENGGKSRLLLLRKINQ